MWANTAYAIIEHNNSYHDFFDELLTLIKAHYADVEYGAQGDAWIKIEQASSVVTIDTFTAMQFEIKSNKDDCLLQDVIKLIASQYPVHHYDEPIER